MAAEQTKQNTAENGATSHWQGGHCGHNITSTSDLLASSLTSVKSTMAESFSEMKESLKNVLVEESPATEETDLQTVNLDEHNTRAVQKQGTRPTEPHTVGKGQNSDSIKQSITKLISQSSESHWEAGGKIDVLSGIANDVKLDHKKAPDVKKHLGEIVHGLMREKLLEEVLTETQNRYNRPVNYECFTTTKVSHLIWDKLKPKPRSSDIKLQCVQSTLAKGVIPMVSIVEKLVQA